MDSAIPKNDKANVLCQPILSDMKPDIMRPGIENPPIRPRAAAEAVGEMPISIAWGTTWTDTAWKARTAAQKIRTIAMKEGVVMTLLVVQPWVLGKFVVLPSPSETVVVPVGLRLITRDDIAMMVKKMMPTIR